MTYVFSKRSWLTLLPFVVLGILIYSNTFDVPFHFDDAHVISDISFEQMLEKCKGGGSRVICHLTFLFNYWLGGTNVFGYHIFNTLVHIGTACFVFVFLFKILSISNTNSEVYASSNQHKDSVLPPLSNPVFWPAFLGGILFLVHPLATQAVTYITQRYASLAGFFYIGSLAFFVSARITFKKEERFLKGSHVAPYACSFVMAVLAMRTKEMSITLPAVVLLTEYYFIQSDFRATTKRVLYLLPLLSTALIIPVSDMIGVKSINLENVAALQDYTWAEGITRGEYFFSQLKIILGIYLKLLVWPIGQNIDHDYAVAKTLLDSCTMASLAGLCVILGTGLWLFKRARFVSFGILWFFVTIFPTSSIVPNTEFVAEHRVYISLMGLAFVIAGLPLWQTHWKRYISVLLPVLFLFSGLSYARNRVWETDLSLWEDSAAKSSKRARPHNNLGVALDKSKRLDEAITHFQEALRIRPNYADAHNNLGVILSKQERFNEAIRHYSKALQINPNHTAAHKNVGITLINAGKLDEAITRFREALLNSPQSADAHYGLGVALSDQGNLDEAISHYSEALRIKPDHEDAHNNLGDALAKRGRAEEAIRHYSEALRIEPNNADAHYNMGVSLMNQGDLKGAFRYYSETLRIKPDFEEACYNMGIVLAAQGRHDESIEYYSRAIQIKPDYVNAHYNLGNALTRQGRFKAAINHYSKALQIKPDYGNARKNLQIILKLLGKSSEISNRVD